MSDDVAALPTDRADAPAGRVIPQDPDALLYQAEAAYLAALSERTLEAFRVNGSGPLFVVIGRGHRGVRYRRGDIIDWIATRRRRSTSDTATAAAPGVER